MKAGALCAQVLLSELAYLLVVWWLMGTGSNARVEDFAGCVVWVWLWLWLWVWLWLLLWF
jgi:hypothetical protein